MTVNTVVTSNTNVLTNARTHKTTNPPTHELVLQGGDKGAASPGGDHGRAVLVGAFHGHVFPETTAGRPLGRRTAGFASAINRSSG
jgi:hypothetical protein